MDHSYGRPPIREISPTELNERLGKPDAPLLIDVREPFEQAIADLPEAGQVRIPLGEIASRVSELDPARETVVYCRSGGRSARVVQFLQDSGFRSVLNLSGGILGWREEVDPSIPEY